MDVLVGPVDGVLRSAYLNWPLSALERNSMNHLRVIYLSLESITQHRDNLCKRPVINSFSFYKNHNETRFIEHIDIKASETECNP
jgi:hypothetical protein